MEQTPGSPDPQQPHPWVQPPNPAQQPPQSDAQQPKPWVQPPNPAQQPPQSDAQQPPQSDAQPPDPAQQPPNPWVQPPNPAQQPPNLDAQPPNPAQQPPNPAQQPNPWAQQQWWPSQQWGSAYPQPYPQWYPPAPPAPRRRRGPIAAAIVGAAAAAVALGLGVSAATSGGGGGVVSGSGSSGNQNPSPAANTTGSATAAQQVGVVDIDTVLQFQQAEAAGTGMILSSSGEVLTNNHVIDGATSIKVTVVSTGKTYTASVVGTDPSDDVAVLQMQGASGLQTAKIGNSSGVGAGDTVTAVGNAGGQGGTPSAATGTVLATGQTMTASDENGGNAETLTDMIEINADVVAGDSGGPLYDSHGNVIGMDTAASTSGGYGRYGYPGSGDGSGAQTLAYAIPTNKALSIAGQIESKHASSKIHIGGTAFLGVSLDDSLSGATVVSVGSGTPAEQAGLQAGDVITSVDGKTINSASDLSSAITSHHPGDKITVTWTDTSGQSHTATATLTTGPAD